MAKIKDVIIRQSNGNFYIVTDDNREIYTAVDSMYFDILTKNEEEVTFICKKQIGVFKPDDLCIQNAEGKQREVIK